MQGTMGRSRGKLTSTSEPNDRKQWRLDRSTGKQSPCSLLHMEALPDLSALTHYRKCLPEGHTCVTRHPRLTSNLTITVMCLMVADTSGSHYSSTLSNGVLRGIWKPRVCTTWSQTAQTQQTTSGSGIPCQGNRLCHLSPKHAIRMRGAL